MTKKQNNLKKAGLNKKILSILLLLALIFTLNPSFIVKAEERPWTENFPYQMPDGYNEGRLSHVISVTKEERTDANNRTFFDMKIVLNTSATDGVEFKEGGRLVLAVCDYKLTGDGGYINWASIPRNTTGEDTMTITLSGLTTDSDTSFFTFSTLEYPTPGEIDPVTGAPTVTKTRGYIWNVGTGGIITNPGGLIPDPDPGITPEPPEEKKEIASLKPHVIVDKYSFGQAGASIIGAGQSIDLNFTLKNTSSWLDVENLIVVISTTEDLSIKSGANTIHIKQITRGETSSQKISLKLKVKTTVDVQKITIKTSFEYFDKKEEDPVAGEDSVDIAIPSGKITRAKVTNITTSKKFKQNSEGSVELAVINNGFSNINNVEIFIKNLDGEEFAWRYIGTLEGGTKSEVQKIPMTFTDFGKKDLVLYITYEDDDLASIEMEKEFFVNIEEVPEEPPYIEPVPDPGIDPGLEEPAPEGLSTINKILIGVGALVLLIIIISLIVKRRRKKKEGFDDFFDAFPKTDIAFDASTKSSATEETDEKSPKDEKTKEEKK